MLLHHPKLVNKPRARKYKPTQALAPPPDPIPFKSDYNPLYLLINYDLETNDLITPNVRIVNIACELDTLLLEQWQKVNRGSSRCVYCDQNTNESTDIRPTVCKSCGDEEDGKESKPHWFETLVNCECKIPAAAQEVHQITDKMITKAPTIKPVLIAMFEWINNLRSWYGLPSDFPVVLNAYNGHKFDQLVLQWELLRCDLLVPHNIWFGDLYFTIVNSFGYPWTREQGQTKMEQVVQRICKRAGYRQEHLAMLDVEAMMDVMYSFMNRQDLYEGIWNDRQRPLVEKQLRQAIQSGGNKQKQKQKYASSNNTKDDYNSSNSNNKYKKQKQRK